MKTPTNCLICNDPLLNTDVSDKITQVQRWQKSCSKYLNHSFFCQTYDEDIDYLSYVSFTTNYLECGCVWHPINKMFYINNKDVPSLWRTIPYFEPDFSDFKKLIDKIKTYVIFL